MPTDYFTITENQVNITIIYSTFINVIGRAKCQKFKGTREFLSEENESFFLVCCVTELSEKTNSKTLLM